jgi:tetratricopeptide (TPR) repeat protein
MRLAAKAWTALLLVQSLAATAQEGGDVQAQILYAYETEDTNTLKAVAQNLSLPAANGAGDVALRYHAAHAQYRLGLLLAQQRARGVDSAFSACIDALKPALERDVKSAEAYALQSACYFQLAESRSLEAVLLRSRAAERIKTAQGLAPKNPRVILIASAQVLARARPGSTEREQAVKQLEVAARIFEASSATRVDAPGWGDAEAYLMLGREFAVRGDRVAARNWVEKAVLAAPEYKAAQQQLKRLAAS